MILNTKLMINFSIPVLIFLLKIGWGILFSHLCFLPSISPKRMSLLSFFAYHPLKPTFWEILANLTVICPWRNCKTGQWANRDKGRPWKKMLNCPQERYFLVYDLLLSNPSNSTLFIDCSVACRVCKKSISYGDPNIQGQHQRRIERWQ